jgi:hypothetical protein
MPKPQPTYPPINAEFRDAILAGFANFKPKPKHP